MKLTDHDVLVSGSFSLWLNVHRILGLFIDFFFFLVLFSVCFSFVICKNVCTTFTWLALQSWETRVSG